MDKVLVGRRRLLQVSRKDEAGDVARLQQDVIPQQMAGNRHDLLVVGQRMERLDPLDPVVNRRELRLPRHVRRMARHRFFRFHPAVDPPRILQHTRNIPPCGKDRLLVHPVSQEQVTIAICPPSQRFPIVR